MAEASVSDDQDWDFLPDFLGSESYEEQDCFSPASFDSAILENAEQELLSVSQTCISSRNERIRFDVRTPIPTFGLSRKYYIEKCLDKIQKNHSEEKFDISDRFIVISGQSGIGKTEFARVIAVLLQNHNIFWINAESPKTINESFAELIIAHCPLIALPSDRNVSPALVNRVYEYFQDKKCVFIFDNADPLSEEQQAEIYLNPFLPIQIDTHLISQLHVIITSTSCAWPTLYTIVPLGPLNEDEGLAYCRMSMKSIATEEKYKELLNELGYFPYALQQAAQYILNLKEDYENYQGATPCPVNEFLRAYRSEANPERSACLQEIFEYEFKDDYGNIKYKSLWQTWKTISSRIAKKPDGAVALEIIQILSFFEADKIPAFLFLSQSPTTPNAHKRRIENAIRCLKSYCILERHGGFLYVHRLTQKIIRFELGDDSIRVMNLAIHHILPFISKGVRNDHKTNEQILQLLRHMKRLASHLLDRKQGNDPDVQNFILLIVRSIDVSGDYKDGIDFASYAFEEISKCSGATEAAYLIEEELGNYTYKARMQGKAAEIFRGILQAYTTAFGEFDSRTLRVEIRLATALNHLSRGWQESLAIFNRVYEKCANKEDITALTARAGRANALKCLGKFHETRDEFEQILDIIKRTEMTPDHDTVKDITEYRLGQTYRELREWDKATEVFEIQERKSRTIHEFNHPSYLAVCIDLIECWINTKEFAKAKNLTERIYETAKNTLTENNYTFFQLREHYGRIKLHFEEFTHDDVINEHIDMLTRKVEIMKLDPVSTIHDEKKIAGVFFDKGEYQEALERFEAVVLRQMKVWPNGHQDIDITNDMIQKCKTKINRQQFVCSVCLEDFICSQTLNRHIKTIHSNIKIYRCDKCGHTTNRADNFKRHLQKTKCKDADDNINKKEGQ